MGFRVTIPPEEGIGGFALHTAGAGEQVEVLCRAILYSDQDDFHTFAEQITSHVLAYSKEPELMNRIDNLVYIVRPPHECEAFVNESTIRLKAIPKGAVSEGQPVGRRHLRDIIGVDVDTLRVAAGDRAAIILRLGWRFGLCFDLRREGIDDPVVFQDMLLAMCKRLLYWDDYRLMEDSDTKKRLVENGWFPFIELLGRDYWELADLYRSRGKTALTDDWFCSRFTQERLQRIAEKWWRNKYFLEKKTIFESAMEALAQSTRTGVLNAIHTLLPQIEGIVRLALRDEPRDEAACGDFKSYLATIALDAIDRKEHRLFPNEFMLYLREYVYGGFKGSDPDPKASRHSVSHGVARENAFTIAFAIQLVLVLDQIYFYLAHARTLHDRAGIGSEES